jgi:carboxylesterase type B
MTDLGIELMAGVTHDECVMWAVGSYPKLKNMTVHITKEELKAKILSMYSTNPTIGQSIYDFYISNVDESNQTAIRQAFASIFSDQIILCPTYYFAKEFAQLSETDKTYFYVTTYKSKYTNCVDDWMGVCHADDVLFMDGSPIHSKSSFNETDYKFSLMAVQMWTDFAKTGYKLINYMQNPFLIIRK